MKKIKINLSKQLLIITFFSLFLMILLLVFVLPKSLEPYFEDTLYNYLSKPLEVIKNDNETREVNNIVYINEKNGSINISPNYKEILGIENYEEILKYLNDNKGKFKYNSKVYYYTIDNHGFKKIAITTDEYIKVLRNNMLKVTIPVVTFIYLIIIILQILWSNMLVRKIEKLKLKIDNFEDPTFDTTSSKMEFDDELKLLNDTVDEMKDLILSKEKYEREMYQNISHDFKTPIMVVKSYLEAYKDKVEDIDNVINICEEEMDKLSNKVEKLLELNKLTYLKDRYVNDEKFDIIKLFEDKITRYKIINKKIKYNLNIKSNDKVNGNYEIWESIIDNIMSNMIRFANKKIEITIKNDEIIFFNDGEKIKDDKINTIFDMYEKDKKGNHGIGLTIVKKNIELIGYKIKAQNTKDGVEFVIIK